MHGVYAQGGCLSSHYSAYPEKPLQDRQTFQRRGLCRAVGVLMRPFDEACMHSVYAQGGCLSSHYSAYLQSPLQDRQTAPEEETLIQGFGRVHEALSQPNKDGLPSTDR